MHIYIDVSIPKAYLALKTLISYFISGYFKAKYDVTSSICFMYIVIFLCNPTALYFQVSVHNCTVELQRELLFDTDQSVLEVQLYLH